MHRHRSVAPQTSSSSSSSSSPSTSSSTGGGYVVQSGDTLSLIARAQGVSGGWRALYDANRGVVSDPNLIYPGQQLVLS
ncbi:MAG: LysM peptidoglycan-binding domain-containing protein [Actinomycetota bacterium]|nr:LysM peptidoglycan-binding domain-containing protein [Actinomycetota bacterium]MDQ3422167.1 LysM peptidoglycan-binding domain-containing protein [Actinomycetota bacterium]